MIHETETNAAATSTSYAGRRPLPWLSCNVATACKLTPRVLNDFDENTKLNEKACGAHIRTRSQTSYLDWVWHVHSSIKGHIGAALRC